MFYGEDVKEVEEDGEEKWFLGIFVLWFEVFVFFKIDYIFFWNLFFLFSFMVGDFLLLDWFFFVCEFIDW